MNNSYKVLIGAAAVVAVAFVGLEFLPRSAVVGGIAPTPSPSLTATPSTTPTQVAAQDGGLPLGRYILAKIGGLYEVGTTITIGALGWVGNDGRGILVKNDNPYPPDGAGLIVFSGQLEIYGDPCRWRSSRPDPMTGATVDEVIAALAVQPGRKASEPVAVTVDGYSGKSIQLSVPIDVDFAHCDGSQYRSWGPESVSRYHQGPGQIDQVWVVNVDGTLMTIDAAWYAGTPDGVRAELGDIVDSIHFDSGSSGASPSP